MSEDTEQQIDELNDLMGRVTADTENIGSTGNIITIYGPAKIGKTSTFARGKETVLVQCKDNSANALKRAGAIPNGINVVNANSFKDAISLGYQILDSGKYTKVVFDGGTGLSEWCNDDVVEANFGGDFDKYMNSFGRDEKAINNLWMQLWGVFNALRDKGIWVYLICHKATLTAKNAGGLDYLMNAPDLVGSKSRLAQTLKYSDHIVFMDFVLANSSVSALNNVAKVSGGNIRMMYCQPAASFEAGGRLNLPPTILMAATAKESAAVWDKAIQEATKGQ